MDERKELINTFYWQKDINVYKINGHETHYSKNLKQLVFTIDESNNATISTTYESKFV